MNCSNGISMVVYISFNYIHVFSWCISLEGKKIWSGTNKKNIESHHEECLQKNVYCLWSNHYYVSLFYLQNHVYYTTNEYILITLYFYVYRWNMKRCNAKLKPINKTIKITQVQVMKILGMQATRAIVVVWVMNDDHRNWMLQYFGMFVCEN